MLPSIYDHHSLFLIITVTRLFPLYLKQSVFVFLYTVCILSAFGCKDDLPVYSEPKKIFDLTLHTLDTSLVTFHYTMSASPKVVLYRTFPSKRDFALHLQHPNNPFVNHGTPFFLEFGLSLENIYEETIQAPAAVTGQIEIWADGHPDHRFSALLNNSILLNYPKYTPDGLFTIDPHERVYFTYSWDFSLDADRWIHDFALPQEEQGEGIGIGTMKYLPLMLNVRVSLRMVENGSVVKTENSFTLNLFGIFQY